ncbi:MAG: hypothetical protein WC350_05335 [Candidatus Micrarchaeia archaeon]
MVMRTCFDGPAVADGKTADRKAEPSKNNRELARLICGDDLQLALPALERISGNQRALAYVAKNAPPELKEKAVEMLSGMLAELTEVGAILAVALHSKNVDAKAKASARILNMDKCLLFEKMRRNLTEDDVEALRFIADKHPDEFKSRLAQAKLPCPSRAQAFELAEDVSEPAEGQPSAGKVEFTEEVQELNEGKLAEILEATQA